MSEMSNFNFSNKLLYHPDFITKIMNDERPFPITLELSLTDKCNHKCKFCFYFDNTDESYTRDNNTLKTNAVLNCIKQAAKLGTKGIVLTGLVNTRDKMPITLKNVTAITV